MCGDAVDICDKHICVINPIRVETDGKTPQHSRGFLNFLLIFPLLEEPISKHGISRNISCFALITKRGARAGLLEHS